MKILSKLEGSKNFWFLLISSFGFFLLRLPSLFEPYWYGDEGIYQVIGIAIRSGRLLYRDIFDNKPPLLYLLYALFNSDQFLVKLASLIFGILSIVVFFFLAKKIFIFNGSSKKALFLTTSAFAILFGIPYLEGNIANAENFMMLPVLMAALLLINYLERVNQKSALKNYRSPLFSIHNSLFISGFLLGIAFLFKIVAVFDLGTFLVFWIFIKMLFKRDTVISNLKEFILLLLGFFIPLALTSFFFMSKGAFPDFLKAVLSSNIGYIGYANKLFIPQGLLVAKLVLLSLFVVFLFLQRKKFKPTEIFVFLWFGFSLFNAFFSGRPYTHYLLILLPSFLLIAGFLFSARIKRLSLIVLATSIVLVFYNFSFFGYKKTISYYNNFTLFILGQKTSSAYQGFFDKKTPVDYALSQFIKFNKTDKDYVFVWGNNAQIYKMIGVLPPGKYIVEYHIVGYKDGLNNTQRALKKRKPKFIAIMPNQLNFPFSLVNYSHKITVHGVLIYERLL